MLWNIAEEQQGHPHDFLGDAILGLNNGAATTLIFALGVAGASHGRNVVIAGLAEMWRVEFNSLIRDELFMRPDEFRNPRKVAGTIGAAFVVGALVPLLPFLLAMSPAQPVATALSVITLFVFGALRSRYSGSTRLRSGREMVTIGLLGAIAGPLIGKLLSLHA